jgi:hypothetical protein
MRPLEGSFLVSDAPATLSDGCYTIVLNERVFFTLKEKGRWRLQSVG